MILLPDFTFTRSKETGLGTYFTESLYSDIESLKLYRGIHRQVYRDFHRMLSKRFPFAIYYKSGPGSRTSMPLLTAEGVQLGSGSIWAEHGEGLAFDLVSKYQNKSPC